MRSGWNLFIILFIFTFGTLFGIETAKDGIRQLGAIPGEPQKPYYVTRIEDGKMIVAPVHSGVSGAAAEAAREKKASSGPEEKDDPDQPRPVLSSHSPLGDLGAKIGEKVSEWTRTLLKTALSLVFG